MYVAKHAAPKKRGGLFFGKTEHEPASEAVPQREVPAQAPVQIEEKAPSPPYEDWKKAETARAQTAVAQPKPPAPQPIAAPVPERQMPKPAYTPDVVPERIPEDKPFDILKMPERESHAQPNHGMKFVEEEPEPSFGLASAEHEGAHMQPEPQDRESSGDDLEQAAVQEVHGRHERPGEPEPVEPTAEIPALPSPKEPEVIRPPVHTEPAAPQEKPVVAAPQKQKKPRDGEPSGFKRTVRRYIKVWIAIALAVCAVVFFFTWKYQKNYKAAEAKSNPDNYIAQNIYAFYPEKLSFTLQKYGSGVSFVADDETLTNAFTAALDGKTIGFSRADDFREVAPTYNITAEGITYAKVSLATMGTDNYGFHVWTFKSVELTEDFFSLSDISITVPKGAAVTVDGVQLDEATVASSTDSHSKLIQDAGVTASETYGYDTYSVRCLKEGLTVSVQYNGRELTQVPSDDDTKYIYTGFAAQDFIDSVSPRVTEMLNTYMDFMYRKAKLADITPYTIADSKAYTAFENVSKDLSWSGSIKSKDVLASNQYDYATYGDNLFAVTTYTKLHITASQEYDEEFTFDWLFQKGDDGQWYVIDFVVSNS